MHTIVGVSLTLLLLSAVVLSHHNWSNLSNPWPAAVAASNRKSDEGRPDSAEKKFACLPKDVRLDEVVSYGRGGKGSVTVEKKLLEMKARCRNGKPVDANKREIRFSRLACWGNPPPDYLEIKKREGEELQRLKKRYTVIVITCDPMTQ
jgi:hypothetical protein